jgi:hypothetical protein
MLKFLQPYLVYIAGVSVLAAAFGGWTARDWQCKAKETATKVAALERAAEESARMQKTVDAQSAAYEKAKADAAAVSVQRTHTIREVFRDVPVDTSCAPPPAVSSVLLDAVEDANRAISPTAR